MRDIFAETAAKIARLKARAAELDAEERRLYSFSRTDNKPGTIVVHEATRKPGTWQITHLDKNNEAERHVESPNREQALLAAGKYHHADLDAGAGRGPRKR